jgi:hypothetical protein
MININYERFKNQGKQIDVLKDRIISITLNRGFLEKLDSTQEQEIKEIENKIEELEETEEVLSKLKWKK